MILIEPGKPVFKGNLHVHTTRSDGRLTPDEVARLYKEHGYDFLALTDHWMPNRPGEYEGMLLLGGAEMDAMLERETVHVVGVGIEGDLLDRVQPGDGPQAMIDAVRAAGGRAILCHPAWSLNTLGTMLSLGGLSAVEIYNTYSGIPWNAARADSSIQVDLALTHGWQGALVASDDAHRYAGEACQSYTMIQCDELSREALLNGLDRGALYASQGPVFHQISCENGLIEIECSPADYIVFYSNQPSSRNRCRSGRDMTSARYKMSPKEVYVRVELTDRYGRRAWSGPIRGAI